MVCLRAALKDHLEFREQVSRKRWAQEGKTPFGEWKISDIWCLLLRHNMLGKKWQEIRLERKVPWVPCGKLELHLVSHHCQPYFPHFFFFFNILPYACPLSYYLLKKKIKISSFLLNPALSNNIPQPSFVILVLFF